MDIEKNCAVIDQGAWRKRRDEAYERFVEDIEIGYVDRDIVEFVKYVFTKKGVFTTSSCSGRITIVDSLYPWLRDESYIVFKRHEPITKDEILDVISQRPMYRFWLISSGPIIHFIVIDLETAKKLLQLSRESGFKHSGIISISNTGIAVEVVSGTWTSFLLKDGDDIVVSNIDKVISIANEVLIEGKKRLEKLFKVFKNADI